VPDVRLNEYTGIPAPPQAAPPAMGGEFLFSGHNNNSPPKGRIISSPLWRGGLAVVITKADRVSVKLFSTPPPAGAPLARGELLFDSDILILV